MRKSIIVENLDADFFDGSTPTEKHHCLHGTANRKKAEEDGLIVGLTHEHHNEPGGVHFSKELDNYFKQLAEVCWIREVMKSEFIDFETALEQFRYRYGKNWL